jgi:hypothetical protein
MPKHYETLCRMEIYSRMHQNRISTGDKLATDLTMLSFLTRAHLLAFYYVQPLQQPFFTLCQDTPACFQATTICCKASPARCQASPARSQASHARCQAFPSCFQDSPARHVKPLLLVFQASPAHCPVSLSLFQPLLLFV